MSWNELTRSYAEEGGCGENPTHWMGNTLRAASWDRMRHFRLVSSTGPLNRNGPGGRYRVRRGKTR